MGRTDSQKGQRLTLRCPSCNRLLRIYLQKKVTSPPQLVVIDGSAHQNGRQRGFMFAVNATTK